MFVKLNLDDNQTFCVIDALLANEQFFHIPYFAKIHLIQISTM